MKSRASNPALPASVPEIEWSAPWLAPCAALGEELHGQWQLQADVAHPVAQALQQAAQRLRLPTAFVAQSALPESQAYEDFIFAQGQVPTRNNLHDFFNGLVWLHYPLSKQRMNALQAHSIAADGVQAVRGPLRDAITVFDENGALFQGPEPLWQALLARDWASLFGTLRPLWAQAQLLVLGHALMEKLVAPRTPMVAHVLYGGPEVMPRAQADAWLAQHITAERWARKPFSAMPVLGVPGWWPANEDPLFYADVQVFRPPRAPLRSPLRVRVAETTPACAAQA